GVVGVARLRRGRIAVGAVAVEIPRVRDRVAVGIARAAAVEVDGEGNRARRRRARCHCDRGLIRRTAVGDAMNRPAVEVDVEQIATWPDLQVERARGAVFEKRDLDWIGPAYRAGVHD